MCEEHLKKKRPNPENPSEHVKICDSCDEKHIKRIILKEFDDKMKKKERDMNELEKIIKEQQLLINDAQREYDNLLVQVFSLLFCIWNNFIRKLEMIRIILIK